MSRGRKKEVPVDPAPTENKNPEIVEVDLKEKKKTTKKVKEKKADVKFECGFAPPGNSTVAFNHTFKGKTHNYTIALENKIFVLPQNLTVEEKKRYRAALIDNNFQDVTVNHGIKFNKQTGKYTYKVVHPEQAERNNINATIALQLTEKNKPIYDDAGQKMTKQVNIMNGVVETDDKRVYEALLQAGFYDAGKKRR